MTYLCAKFYLMRKTFKVAGFRFAVVMPDDDVAWNEMHNYEPFLTDDSTDCIFIAEMIDKLPELPGKRLVSVGAQGPGFPRHEIYEFDGGWMIASAPDLEAPIRFYLVTDKSFSKAQFVVLGSPRFSVNSTLMLMFTFATARRDTLLMHASVTMNGGKGYLFLGKSGTGKSTHSQLWINNIEGCELLNDDNPVLHVEADGSVRVYGSPWSGKTPCYRNLDVPVGAIVDLHQAKKNVIRRLSLAESYAIIYVSFSGLRFVKEMADEQHRTNEKIIMKVPCYSLDCLPDADAALLCHQTVAL